MKLGRWPFITASSSIFALKAAVVHPQQVEKIYFQFHVGRTTMMSRYGRNYVHQHGPVFTYSLLYRLAAHKGFNYTTCILREMLKFDRQFFSATKEILR